MQNIGRILIIVALLVIGFIVGTVYTPWNGRLAKNDQPGTSLPLAVISLREKTELYTIRAEYPDLRSLPNEFNQQIKYAITQRIDEFKRNAAENWEARKATDSVMVSASGPEIPYSMNIEWEPAQLNPSYISFIVRFNAYEGGANERQELVTFNYDVAKRKVLALADLYPTDPNYLTNFSETAKQQLSQTIEGEFAKEMLDAGIAPTIENFANFTFTDDIIIVYFPKYQVAPGAYGEQKMIMPRAETFE